MNTQSIAGCGDKSAGCCCATNKLVGSESHTADKGNVDKAITQQLQVQGVTCGGCVSNVEAAILAIPGVKRAKMDLSTGIATVTGTADIERVIASIAEGGYQVNSVSNNPQVQTMVEGKSR